MKSKRPAPNSSLFATIRAIRGLSSVFPPSDSGSALILVLLITALLSTIAVSFLSTSRLEQISTRNFTRKTTANGLAEYATQQAIGTIQQGFTINASGNSTVVITTQPGAIRQFVFSGGNITSNTTTALFSVAGNSSSATIVDLNNLQNPSGNSSATSNQWTITGNASEKILVQMNNLTSNGTVVGRYAFYVDDEGTKINLNSATGNRSILNAAIRPQDIGVLGPSSSSSFANIVNGLASNGTTSPANWGYFFRPEQLQGALTGFSGNYIPYLTAFNTSANSTANMTHLLTPWGTQRLYINELPITSTGVNRTFTALTGISSNGSTANDLANGRALQNIFSGNFSTKYTDIGVKQIAANILQMRDPNTFSVNASLNYSGQLLGADNLDANGIPLEYLGYAPYPVISQIGFGAHFCYEGNITYSNGTGFIYIVIEPFVELTNPYSYDFAIPASNPRLDFKINTIQFTMNYTYTSNNTTTTNSSVITLPNTSPLPPFNLQRIYNNPISTTTNIYYDELKEFILINNGTYTFPKKSKIQTHICGNATSWGAIRADCRINTGYSGNFTINSISDFKILPEYVKLVATAGSNNTVRDWVTGNETGYIMLDNPKRNKLDPLPFKCFNGANTTCGMVVIPKNTNPCDSTATATMVPTVPTNSSQRVSLINKTPSNCFSGLNDETRNWATSNSSVSSYWTLGNATWSSNSSTYYGQQGITANLTNPNSDICRPLASSNATLSSGTPSDPSFSNNMTNAAYADISESNDMREPYLVTGNYTCPADLGFVPTNRRWRRLRMQMQPRAEGSLIPDWAMLDAISFGNFTNATNPVTRQHPVNINGRFNLPGNVSNSSPAAPRAIAIQALAQVLGISTTGTIQNPMNPATSNSTDTTRFRGAIGNATTIAGNIANMTWSANSAWGQGNATSDPGSRRKSRSFPANTYILPSEIMEIAGVADDVSQTNYNNTTSHFKWNEGRASALLPAVSTRSSFFTIYAYAQALDKSGNIDSEALSKTLVEVQFNAGNYTVKKIYTQPIQLGQ